MQGKGARAADKAVAMVMKEIPREESAEEKPLLTVASQVGGARGSEGAAGAARVPSPTG